MQINPVLTKNENEVLQNFYFSLSSEKFVHLDEGFMNYSGYQLHFAAVKLIFFQAALAFVIHIAVYLFPMKAQSL